MNETSKLPEDANCTTDGSHHRLSRRMFISASAATVGGFAIWSLRPTNIASAAPGTADALPPTVTIVEFGTNGKVTGKLVVPTVAKTDAGWNVSYRRSPTMSPVVRARSGLTQATPGIYMITDFFVASAATLRSLALTRSLIPVQDGRVSGNLSRKRMSWSGSTAHSGWIVRQFHVGDAMPI